MHPGHTLIKAVCREWRQAGSCYSPSSTPGCKQQLFVSWKLGMRHCPSSSGGRSPSVEVWSLQSQGRKERAERGRAGVGVGAPGTSCLHSQQSQGAAWLLAPLHLRKLPFLCLESTLENTLSIRCVRHSREMSKFTATSTSCIRVEN